MSRKPFLAGNWKMNLTASESVELAKQLKENLSAVSGRTVMIAPNFSALYSVNEVIKGTNIALGAQNMYFEANGAFTGELSADMLKDVGVTYVILGHSERRSIFNEPNEWINKKVKAALANELLPVLCIGETLNERESGKMNDVLRDQLTGSLSGISAEEMKKITVAYEPVWAIGTGKTASPEDADNAHQFVRDVLKDLYGMDTANNTVIQYGGSVKDSNVDGLMAMENIDGALVGGAALKADSFSRIVKFEA